MEFLRETLPIVVAILGTAGFFFYIWVFWRNRRVLASRSESGQITPIPVSRVLLRSAAWVFGVKIIVLVAASIYTGEMQSAEALWMRSDAPHYLSIAQNGYQTVGDPRFFIVFFPLYPAIWRLFSTITGEWFWTGSLISMLCLVGAGYFLFRMTEKEYGAAAAKRTLKYFMLFPSIFFAGLPFTEGLFFLLTFAALYALRLRRFILAGVLGLLSALTRSLGVLIAISILVEASICAIQMGTTRREKWKNWVRLCWPAILPAIGTLLYLALNQAVHGNPLQFMIYQKEHWYQGFGFLGNTFYYLTKNLFDYEISSCIWLWIPELLSMFAMLAVLILAAKRIRREYLLYGGIYYFSSLSVTWLLSAPRYLLAMVPCFMEMGRRLERRRGDYLLTGILGVLLIVFSCGFASGMSIY